MGSQRKLWEDMAPLEKLAAIRELAEQLKALRDDGALRHEAEESQPIQLRPSACSRLGDAFLLSTAIPLDHSAARFDLLRYPAWNVSPATERDGTSYFGDEKPRQQKLAALIEDVTDRKKTRHATRSAAARKLAHTEVIGDANVYTAPTATNPLQGTIKS
jgi:hypothetical protein